VNTLRKPSLRHLFVRWWNWLQAGERPAISYKGAGHYSQFRLCRLALENLEDRLPPGDTAGGYLLPIMLLSPSQDPLSSNALLGEERSATVGRGTEDWMQEKPANPQGANLIALLTMSGGGGASATQAGETEGETPKTSDSGAPWGAALSDNLGLLPTVGIPLGLSESTTTGQASPGDPSLLLARASSALGTADASPGSDGSPSGNSSHANLAHTPAANASSQEIPNLLPPVLSQLSSPVQVVKPTVSLMGIHPVVGGTITGVPAALTSSVTPLFAHGGAGIVAARGTEETAPVANDDYYGVHPNMTLTVSAVNGVVANDTDAEGDPIFATLISGPANGTLSLDDSGAFSYTPNADFTGTDSFTYQADDGQLAGNIATVTLNVHATNSAPVANDASYSVTHDQTLNLPLVTGSILQHATDSDGDPLSASVVTAPSNGSLTLAADGSFVYTPNARFVGTDTFTYSASDGLASSSPGTVTINVINNAPVVEAASYDVPHDQTLLAGPDRALSTVAYDVDGDPVTLSLVSPPSHGMLFANGNGGSPGTGGPGSPPGGNGNSPAINPDGTFTYQPVPGFTGIDSFTYKANDGFTNSVPATVTILVYNTAPVAQDDVYQGGNSPAGSNYSLPINLWVLTNDTDAEGDSLRIDLQSPAGHGSLAVVGQHVVYTPVPGYYGTDSFTYSVNDGLLESNVANVYITLYGPGYPVGFNDVYSVAAGAELNVAAPGVLNNDGSWNYLPNGEVPGPLEAELLSGPANGNLTLNQDGSFDYQPAAGFAGVDTFSYCPVEPVFAADGVTQVGLLTGNATEVDVIVPTVWVNVAGVAAGNNLNPGGFVAVNANNDNGSAVKDEIPALRDFNVPFKTIFNLNGQNWFRDPDLVPGSFFAAPAAPPVWNGGQGTITFSLTYTGTGRIRLWEQPRAFAQAVIAPDQIVPNVAYKLGQIPREFYLEGLEPSSAMGDIKLTITFTDNSGPQPVAVTDSVVLTVTPVVDTFKIMAGAVRLVSDPIGVIAIQAALPGSPMIPGAAFKATLKAQRVGGTPIFIQNMTNVKNGSNGAQAGLVFNPASGVANRNTLPVRDAQGKRLPFPFLDTNPPGVPPDYHIHPVTTWNGSVVSISDDDSPALQGPPAGMRACVDIDEVSEFKLYIVWRFPGQGQGTSVLYTIASTTWSVVFRATRDATKPGAGVNVLDQRSGVFPAPAFDRNHADPARLTPPVANVAVQPTTDAS
jgi:VCBS repeat-containing protein